MTAMPTAIRSTYTAEMAAARTSTEDTQRWSHLERARPSCPSPIRSRTPATTSPCSSSPCANTTAGRPSARSAGITVAAPGSVLGRYPEGNTGRTRAGLMTPMPIPADLAATLASTS